MLRVLNLFAGAILYRDKKAPYLRVVVNSFICYLTMRIEENLPLLCIHYIKFIWGCKTLLKHPY